MHTTHKTLQYTLVHTGERINAMVSRDCIGVLLHVRVYRAQIVASECVHMRIYCIHRFCFALSRSRHCPSLSSALARSRFRHHCHTHTSPNRYEFLSCILSLSLPPAKHLAGWSRRLHSSDRCARANVGEYISEYTPIWPNAQWLCRAACVFRRLFDNISQTQLDYTDVCFQFYHLVFILIFVRICV